jgi:hypothetical protein
MLLQIVLIYCLDLKIKNGVLMFSCSNGSVRNGSVRGSVRNVRGSVRNVRGSVRNVRGSVRNVRGSVRGSIGMPMPVGFQLGDLMQRVTLLLRLLRY